MATEIGSAYARFTLDIAGLRKGLTEAKQLLGQFQKDLEKDLVAKIRIELPQTINMPRLSAPLQQAIGKAAQQVAPTTAAAQSPTFTAEEQAKRAEIEALIQETQARLDAAVQLRLGSEATKLARQEKLKDLEAQRTTINLNTNPDEYRKIQNSIRSMSGSVTKAVQAWDTIVLHEYDIEQELKKLKGKLAAIKPSGGTPAATASAGGSPPGGAVPGGPDAENLAKSLDNVAKNELRVLAQSRDYAALVAKLNELLVTHAGNVELVARLKGDLATAERLYNAQLTKQTVFIAESAAANGNYLEGLTKIAGRLGDTVQNSEEWISLVKSARGIMADQTKEINANSDALIDNAKKRGEFQQALGLNQAAQAATTDPSRRRALESEEIDILAKLATQNRLLANETIDAAIAQKDFFTATTLINKELASGGGNIQREIALRELLTKVTRAETQARYDELDAITASKKLAGDTIGAFRSNVQATGEAQRAPLQDEERLAALERERIKLGQQLTQQQRAEADAAVRAVTAQRDYWAALMDVQTQLQLVNAGSQRFSQLKATEADLVRKIGNEMDREAVSTARLQQSQSQHSAAIQTLRDAMVGLTAGSERYIALQQELTNVELRARAASQAVADTITAQMIAQKRYADAVAYNTAKQAQTPAGPAGAQRRVDLELELIQIQNAQAAADARKVQSNVRLSRQLNDFADAIKRLSAEQAKYLVTDKIWIDLETQKRAIMEQMENETRKDADQAIRAAKANKDWAEAVRILTIEQNRAAATGDSRRTNQLSVVASGINAAQGPGIFAQIIEGATRILGPLSAGMIAFTAFRVARDQLTEGSRVAAELERERRSIGAMVEGVQTGNKIFDQAITFGRKYAQTQEEMGKAADEAGIILRTTTADAAKVFEVLARLQTRAPGKDFGDAVRSITELQAGQLQSIERVFNVPKRFAQELSDAIQAGQDPIIALDAVLNKLGQTADVLDVKLTGPEKQFKDLKVAMEGLRIEAGLVINQFSGPIAEGISKIVQGYNDIAVGIRAVTKLEAERREADRLNKGGAPGPAQAGPQTGPALLPAVQSKGGILGDITAGAENKLRSAYNTLLLLENLGPQAAKEMAKGFDAAGVSIKQLRDIALQAAPALNGLLPGTTAKAAPTPIVDQLSQMTALINQANEGTITFGKLAEKGRELTGIKFGDDFLGTIQKVNSQTTDVTERITLLQQSLINVHKVMDLQPNPQLAARYIPEIVAIENQLSVLEAMSPIEITIEMRVEQMGVATAALDAISKQITQTQGTIDKGNADIKRSNDEFNRQQHYALIDHNQQMQKARDDFYKQQQRADASHTAQMNQAQEDFNRQQGRSEFDYNLQRSQQQRDFNIQDARSTEDHERAKLEKKKDRQKEEARAERDFLYNMQKMRRDFDISQARNQEDFELDRRKLLAEGRIKEAQLLEERYNITKRRAGEDFGRSRSDAGDSFAQTRADRKTDQEEQDKQDDANFKRERDRRLADYAQQRADQQAAHDLQNARAQEDFTRTQKQQEDAYGAQRKMQEDDFIAAQQAQETQFAEQTRRANEQHFIQTEAQRAAQTEQLNLLNKYLADQKEALEQAKRDQLEILALKTQGFTDEEAKAIVALQAAQREFDKSMEAFDKTAIEGGAKSALLYIENFAKGLLKNLEPQVGGALDHYGDYIKSKSPPKKGPLSTIDKDGYNVGKLWADSFAKGLAPNANFTNTLEQAYKQPTNGKPLGDYHATPRDVTVWTAQGSQQGSRHLVVTVPIGLTMDAKTVGQLVTPHIADQFIDDLQVSVNVVDASQKIALTQPGFRGGPSATRSGG